MVKCSLAAVQHERISANKNVRSKRTSVLSHGQERELADSTTPTSNAPPVSVTASALSTLMASSGSSGHRSLMYPSGWNSGTNVSLTDTSDQATACPRLLFSTGNSSSRPHLETPLLRQMSCLSVNFASSQFPGLLAFPLFKHFNHLTNSFCWKNRFSS